MLVFHAIITEEFDVRSARDRRTRVTRVLAEYRDEAGDVYRKSFESAPNMRPSIPRRARDHAELNAQRFQQ